MDELISNGTGRRHALTGWRYKTTVLAGLLGFLAATNRWMTWQKGYLLLRAHDEIDYRAIAVAAPRFPSVKLQVQHAQRFVPHYVIGLAGHLIDLDVLYSVAALLLAVSTVVLLALNLDRANASQPVFAACMAVFALNTYSLRYYGLAPGELADLLLDAAVLLTILGLLERRYWLVLVGTAIGTAARQTDVPVVVAVALWLLIDPNWRSDRLFRRLLRPAVVLSVCAGLYAVLVIASASFSAQTTPDFSHFTLLADLEALSAHGRQLGQHFLRCANDLFSIGPLLFVALVVRRRERRARLPFAFWGCLMIAAAVSRSGQDGRAGRAQLPRLSQWRSRITAAVNTARAR